MKELVSIQTEEEYQYGLKQVYRLMNSPITPNNRKEFEYWGAMVEEYENIHFHIPTPDPIDAILFRMEQQDLTYDDMIPYFGDKKTAEEVLSRKCPLTLEMARKLHKGLGISAKSLIADPEEQPEEQLREQPAEQLEPVK